METNGPTPANVRPLTIMLVAAYVAPHLGGVERYVFNLGKQLVDRYGCRVIVAVTATADVSIAQTEALFREVDGLELRWLPAFGKISNTPLGIGWKRRLKKIIDEENVDLVNAHGPVPLVADIAASASSRIPFVLTYHSGPMRKGRWWIDVALRLYERIVLRRTIKRSDAVVCTSDYVKRTLPNLIGWPPALIYPAVDPEMFSPAGAPIAFRVLFVASLLSATRYKGLSNLFDAIVSLRAQGYPIDLEVVGDGDDMHYYTKAAAQLGIAEHVLFSGSLNKDRLAEAYRRNAVIAVPSLFDNFPTVAVEAMACARPVVATDVGSIPDLVLHGETGLIVPPGDSNALAEGLIRIFDDPNLAQRMGSNGRAKVLAELRAEAQAAATMNVYRDVLARRSHQVTRVGIVAPWYPPRIGGVERYVERLASMLHASPQHDVVVICANDSRESRVEVRDGVVVVRLGTRWTISQTPVNPAWLWQVHRVLKRFQVDIVNAHSPVPFMADIVALFTRKRPVVLTYHCGTLQKGRPLIDVVLRLYEKIILPLVFKRCAGLVAVSPISMTYQFKRTRMVQCGVDIDAFSPPDANAGLSPTIVYVGRVERASRWKGVDVLIDAIPFITAEIPDARVEIVGTGDWVPELKERARALGVESNVCWRGALLGAELTDAYRRAGVVALPSLTDAEAFGTILIEAMACGRPVVASDIGGIPFTMRDKVDGLLVPPGDPAALAEACLTILRDPELSRRMGAAGRQAAVESWEWSRLMTKMVDYMDELVVPQVAI